MCAYDYTSMSDQMLLDMIRYNAAKLAKAPSAVLSEVREDLEEIALLLVPACEFAEEKVAGVHGAPDSLFMAPPAAR